MRTLVWWRSRLRKLSASAQTLERDEAGVRIARGPGRPRVRIAKVVSTMGGGVAAVAVEVCGARIIVQRGFDTALLREVVRALGGRP